MDTRPDQPPEGRLIADAAERLDLSIREAARRAGLSYGRWRQITAGYQNVSPGVYAPVHAPARTVAKMALVVGVTPEQMETQGRRPDAAEIMRQDARPAAVPAPRPVLDFSKAEPGLKPFTQQVLGEIYARIGFPPGAGPGREAPELPQDAAALPGRFLFSEERESGVWDDPRILTVGEKVRTIALMRKISAEWGEGKGRRRTG